MTKEDLKNRLVNMFEIKGFKDYQKQVIVLTEAFFKTKFTQEQIYNSIEQMALKATPYRIEFAHFLEIIEPTDNLETEALEQWDRLRKLSTGNTRYYKDFEYPNELAHKCMSILGGIKDLGYEDNEFTRNKTERDFVKLYTDKKATGNYKQLAHAEKTLIGE